MVLFNSKLTYVLLPSGATYIAHSMDARPAAQNSNPCRQLHANWSERIRQIEIILRMVYNLPTLLVILCGAVCIPPAIVSWCQPTSYSAALPATSQDVHIRQSCCYLSCTPYSILLRHWQPLAAVTGVALNGPNLGHSDLIDDACMTDALGVFKNIWSPAVGYPCDTVLDFIILSRRRV